MEFTVEHGKLFMLQTRNGKRTAQAALKIACDLVDEGMMNRRRSRSYDRSRVTWTPCCTRSLTLTRIKAATPVGKGLGASPGAACGKDRIHR